MPERLEKKHLERLRQGDSESFKWIYNKYHKKIFHYCLQYVRSTLIAEEITGDVFIRFWKKRTIVDSSHLAGPLLFKITKDYTWNYLKKISRENGLKQQYTLNYIRPFTQDGEFELIFNEYLDIVEDAVNTLPNKRKQVFQKRYKEGLDTKQIAEDMGISKSTVKVHLFKATKIVKEYLSLHTDIDFNISVGIILLMIFLN